jgi:hypothetical protein
MVSTETWLPTYWQVNAVRPTERTTNLKKMANREKNGGEGFCIYYNEYLHSGIGAH